MTFPFAVALPEPIAASESSLATSFALLVCLSLLASLICLVMATLFTVQFSKIPHDRYHVAWFIEFNGRVSRVLHESMILSLVLVMAAVGVALYSYMPQHVASGICALYTVVTVMVYMYAHACLLFFFNPKLGRHVLDLS
jgi:hypothetical protein